MRIKRLDSSYVNCSVGGWQRRAVSQVNGHGVSKMANPAVLVFVGLAMPVAGGLEGKGHNQESHKSGQDPAGYPRPRVQLKTPKEMVVRRSKECNRC
jgi:hypothetical protein